MGGAEEVINFCYLLVGAPCWSKLELDTDVIQNRNTLAMEIGPAGVQGVLREQLPSVSHLLGLVGQEMEKCP